MTKKKSDKLELAEMIKGLRAQLAEAQAEGEGKDIRFTVEDVELELQIAAEKGKDGSLGAKFYVFTSQFKATEKDVVTQKLKLKLKPENQVLDAGSGEKKSVPLQVGGDVDA